MFESRKQARNKVRHRAGGSVDMHLENAALRAAACVACRRSPPRYTALSRKLLDSIPAAGVGVFAARALSAFAGSASLRALFSSDCAHSSSVDPGAHAASSVGAGWGSCAPGWGSDECAGSRRAGEGWGVCAGSSGGADPDWSVQARVVAGSRGAVYGAFLTILISDLAIFRALACFIHQ